MVLEEMKKVIDQKDVVSFDIFDTLLFRNIYRPTDLFKIMENEVWEEYQIKNFASLRVKCEADSRNEENGGETSLDEIYELMGKRVEQDVKAIKQREIELELEFIDDNSAMKEVFDYAIQEKKRVVLISDMYLSSEVIKKLLKKAGYSSVPVYVSCEYHVGKGTTGLYEVAREKEKLNKNKWVHIGDNLQSDYKKAKEFGIEAILYENIREKDELEEPETVEASIIRGIQNNYLYGGKELSYWEKFGVLYASPIYYGFTNWLFRLTKDEDNMFFLSRDGYVIKKVYDAFKASEGVNIDTYYLYCSRKTFQLPALLHKTKDELIEFLGAFTNDYDYDITIGDVLENLGLDYENYKEVMSVFGFDEADDVIDKDSFYRVKMFLKYAYSDIEVELKGAEKRVLKYLKQEGLYKYDKINIMDVGWGGSIQEAMRTLLNKEIMGYYFGTIPTSKVDILSNSLGYAFDGAKPDGRFGKIFNMPMMYEFLFSAPHGTTTELREKNGKMIPVLDDDEEYARITELMQGAALEVIKTYLKYAKYLVNISVDDSLANYDELIERRDFEDLCEFSKLTNSVIYTNNKNSYVNAFEEDYIYDNYNEFVELIHKAMWRDSYLVEGIETREEWDAYKLRLDEYLHPKAPKPSKKSYIVKGIKHPRKAARYVKNRIVKK